MTHRDDHPSPRDPGPRRRRCRDAVALREKDFGIWQEMTWADYWDHDRARRHALLALGVEPGDRVAIHSENRPEWLIADMGALAVRAATVGIYPTNPAAEVGYLLVDSGREGARRRGPGAGRQGARGLDELPDLERIVYLEPRGIRGRYDDPTLMSLGGVPRARPRSTATSDPHAVARARWRRPARRPGHPDLHLGHDRAAQGRDAQRRQRRVRDRGARARTARSPTRRPARDDLLAVLPPAQPRRRADLHAPGSTRPPAPRSTSPSRSRPCRRTSARCSRRSSSGSRGSGRSCSPGVEIRLAGATWLKRRPRRFWLGVADRIGDALVANGGGHTARHAAAVRRSAGCCSSARCKERLGMRKVRYAASGRGADRARGAASSSWASACRCTRSTG